MENHDFDKCNLANSSIVNGIIDADFIGFTTSHYAMIKTGNLTIPSQIRPENSPKSTGYLLHE